MAKGNKLHVGAQVENVRILIVEDYRESAQAFEMFFEMEGFSVTIESNPLAALKLVEWEIFQVFLIDVGLDNISGIELARRLRKMPFAKASILIAITGLGESYRSACCTAGFDEYFTKPTDIAHIVSAIKSRLAV